MGRWSMLYCAIIPAASEMVQAELAQTSGLDARKLKMRQLLGISIIAITLARSLSVTMPNGLPYAVTMTLPIFFSSIICAASCAVLAWFILATSRVMILETVIQSWLAGFLGSLVLV